MFRPATNIETKQADNIEDINLIANSGRNCRKKLSLNTLKKIKVPKEILPPSIIDATGSNIISEDDDIIMPLYIKYIFTLNMHWIKTFGFNFSVDKTKEIKIPEEIDSNVFEKAAEIKFYWLDFYLIFVADNKLPEELNAPH